MNAWSISVIIPVYNGERFLAEAIESVLAQDLSAGELIVVDDGSTDGSAAVASSFGEVTLLRQPNGGPAAARNAALRASSGEFIALLDADDLMAPRRLWSQASHLAANPDTDGVLGRQRVRLEPRAEPTPWMHDLRAALDEPGRAPRADLGPVEPFYPAPTLTVRRRAFDLVGEWDTSFPLCEDVEWIMRATEAGLRIDKIDRVAITRRVHGSNLTYDSAGVRHHMVRLFKARLDRKREAASATRPD